MLFLKWFHLLRRYKFGENILSGAGNVTAKRNSKEYPLVAEFNFRFHFFQLPVFRDLQICHRAKLQRTSDHPRLSYCDLTNLWCVRCVGNMFYLHNSSEISFCINILNIVQMSWCFAHAGVPRKRNFASDRWQQFSAERGGGLCRGFTPDGRCPGAHSYLSSWKISAKLNNPRTSYSDLIN